MAKVTTKLQVTVPKGLAQQYGIHPGDQIEFQAAGDLIRIIPPARRRPALDVARRLQLFDQATERLRQRQQSTGTPPKDRGWTREEIYQRGGPR